MSEEYTLEIFKPLKQYFDILCTNNCYDYENCKDLMNTLIRDNCEDIYLSQNFLDALGNFVRNLKKADCAVGQITIKNKLKNIFDNVVDKINNKDEFIKFVTMFVNNERLNNFKMTDKIYENNTDNKTYKDILIEVYDSSVNKNIDTIFNNWKNHF